MDNMYVRYAKAVLAGERDINNLGGSMKAKVQIELDKLQPKEEVPVASPDNIPTTPESVQANVPK